MSIPTDGALTPHAHLELLLRHLRTAYGPVTLQPSGDVLGELVGTILSQHTSDHNADVAYRSLRQRFPTWEQVCTASDTAIADAIRSAGLSRQKAPLLRTVVCTMLAEGQQRVQWLATAPLEEAQSWLQSLPGVGPKTAACVLLFALGRPALPVDTHVYRVARRLGLLPARCTAERAHQLLARLVPPAYRADFHVLLIRHGRQCCHARAPQCPHCPILALCPTGQRQAGEKVHHGKDEKDGRNNGGICPPWTNSQQSSGAP